MIKEMTCINCPMGCTLSVEINDKEIKVSGNTCPRGEIYAKAEISHPERVVTSTIALTNGGRVSCKTKNPVPKEMIFKVMEEIKKTKIGTPIKIGDVLIENVAGSRVDVVATKNVA